MDIRVRVQERSFYTNLQGSFVIDEIGVGYRVAPTSNGKGPLPH